MHKAFPLAVLVGGVALVIFGIGASQSLASDNSGSITRLPTDNATWLLIGGAALGIVGLAGLLFSRRRTPRKLALPHA
jgi:LPXTG-motif cell wall-anchored protein